VSALDVEQDELKEILALLRGAAIKNRYVRGGNPAKGVRLDALADRLEQDAAADATLGEGSIDDALWNDVVAVSRLVDRPASETVRLALESYLERLPGGRESLAPYRGARS
jgi:hypothetical protein